MRRRNLAAALAVCVPLLYASAGGAFSPPRENSDDREQLRELRKTVTAQAERIRDLEEEARALREATGELRKAARAQADRVGALEERVGELRAEVQRLRGNRKELVGAWRVVSVREGGARKEAGASRVVVSERTLTFESPDGKEDRVYRYRANPAEDPNEIDVQCGGVRPVLGIYKVERRGGDPDRLVLCLDRGNAVRPLSFDAAGDGAAVWTLERVGGSAVPDAAPASAPATRSRGD
jgi:uncharacterized protein (TIGR03067 family)